MKKLYFYLLLSWATLYGQVVTSDLEYLKVTGVGYNWQTVSLSNSYSNAIVVCSSVLPSAASNEVVTRVRSIGSSSFQLKIQQPNDSDPGYSTDVYCIVSDEGSYTVPFKYEAHKVISTDTSGNNANGWNGTGENVSGSITQTYTSPAVLGQVMSFNDSQFSVFWSYDCERRQNQPFQSGMADGICVGKHISKVSGTRNNETVGYIVAESGTYHSNGIDMKVALGADSIRGVDNSPPYNYSLGQIYSHGVVTKEAEDGGDGGWGVLYGTSPISSSLSLAIDEAMVNNNSRSHTTEQVAYWVFNKVPVNYADMIINEVMYRQNNTGSTNDEFIEFYVTQSGSILNFLVTDQDGSSHQYRFPDTTVNSGDYVILHIGNGTDNTVGNVHHFYMGISQILNDGGDDIVLLKPSNSYTTVVDGITVNAVPEDYIAYGGGGDAIPTTTSPSTVSWDSANQGELSGAAKGQSISLTPNGVDSNSAKCWELTTSGNASNNGCPNYLPTRATDVTYKNSEGKNNNSTAKLTVTKTSIVTADGVNAPNPKRIPGATIRYCFTVDNTGIANADNATINDSLTGTGKDNLTYVKSGFVVQDIATACDCKALTDTSGTISGTDVSINMGTLTGTNATTTSRGCAYIEMTIQ